MSVPGGVTAPSDEKLMTILIDGDDRAWAEIARRYRDHLVRFCAGYMRDEHLAEDVADEVLLRVYDRSDSYDPGRPFRPWLYRVTRNHCLNRIRRRDSGPVDWGRNSSLAILINGFRDSTTSPDGKAERTDLRELVGEALRGLPEDYRAALVLRYWHDLQPREVAEVLGITPENARVRLFRAVAKLRQVVEPRLGSDGNDGNRSVHPADRHT